VLNNCSHLFLRISTLVLWHSYVFWCCLTTDDMINKRNGKNSTRLVISAVATVGALLLVALMCFWGCFLYKNFGKKDMRGFRVELCGGNRGM
jgi:hypothetical protein